MHHDRHRVKACDNLPCYQVDCSTDTVTAAHVFEDTHYYGPEDYGCTSDYYMYLHVHYMYLHVHYMYITCTLHVQGELKAGRSHGVNPNPNEVRGR